MLKTALLRLMSFNKQLHQDLLKERTHRRIERMDLEDERIETRKSKKQLRGEIINLKRQLLDQQTEFTKANVELEQKLAVYDVIFCDDDFVLDDSNSKPVDEGPKVLTPEKQPTEVGDRCLRNGRVSKKLIMHYKRKRNGNFRLYKSGVSNPRLDTSKGGNMCTACT